MIEEDPRPRSLTPFARGKASQELLSQILLLAERGGITTLGGGVNERDLPLRLVCDLCELYGRSLKKFSESGWYRYSGNLGNVAYSRNEDAVLMVDLDSC